MTLISHKLVTDECHCASVSSDLKALYKFVIIIIIIEASKVAVTYS